MNANEIKFCWEIDELRCMMKWRNVIFQKSLNELCPYCVQQCVEGKYEIQITKTRISNRGIGRFIKGSNAEYIRKNYLSVHFYFSSMSVLLIEEWQQFTLKDTFIFIGGNIGLFLGMSFISPFEIVDIVIQLLHGLFKKLGRRIVRKKRSKVVPRNSLRRNQTERNKWQKTVPIRRGRINTIIIVKPIPVLQNES